jgi:hypothetical protein
MALFKVPWSLTPTAAADCLEVVAHSTKLLVFSGIEIHNLSDWGDAQEEILEFLFSTGHTSGGSGGSSVTPKAFQLPYGTAGFTASHQNTTPASGGTIEERGRYGFNVRMPLDKIFTEKEEIWMSPGLRGVFKLNTNPQDSITLKGELLFAEYG